jgi:hypothetical protein
LAESERAAPGGRGRRGGDRGLKPAPRAEPLRVLVVEHDQADAELALVALDRAGGAGRS